MRRNILIVEDEAVLRKHLARLFVRAGYDVATADTCAGARALLECSRFDAALFDIQLPDGNGFELLAGLHDSRRPHHAILMTAFSSPEHEARARRLNIRMVRKPLDLWHMVDIVSSGPTAAI